MTIQEMRSWFDVIQDKFNSPYFTDIEFEGFINQAQINFVNDIIYSQDQPASVPGNNRAKSNSIESDYRNLEAIRSIVANDLDVNSNSDGVITFDEINNSIDLFFGYQGNTYMNILNLYKGGSTPVLCKFVRYSDINKFRLNKYKNPTSNDPVFTISSKGVNIFPISQGAYKVSLVKRPVDVSIENSVDCEIPVEYHYNIVAYAAKIASIASRDEALAVMLNNK